MARLAPDRTLVNLAAYNRWANARVLARASLLADEDRRSPAPGTAGTIEITTIHLVETEQYFASLISGGPMDDPSVDLRWVVLVGLVESADSEILTQIESLDQRALERRVDRDGRPYAVRDLLLQALTHSHQHRTQIAAAVDMRGVPVKATDHIDFVDAAGASDHHSDRPGPPRTVS